MVPPLGNCYACVRISLKQQLYMIKQQISLFRILIVFSYQILALWFVLVIALSIRVAVPDSILFTCIVFHVV